MYTAHQQTTTCFKIECFSNFLIFFTEFQNEVRQTYSESTNHDLLQNLFFIKSFAVFFTEFQFRGDETPDDDKQV
jgi:hypothetical protein